MGHIVRFLKSNVLVRKDTLKETSVEELAKLRGQELGKITKELDRINRRIDEINAKSQLPGIKDEEITAFLQVLEGLDDKKKKLSVRQDVLLKLPLDQTLGEHRDIYVIVAYAENAGKADYFMDFHKKHCKRDWEDQVLWAKDARTKVADVMVVMPPLGQSPPVDIPTDVQAREVLEACLKKTDLREGPRIKVTVVPLPQVLGNTQVFTRKYDFEKKAFVDNQYSAGGFLFEEWYLNDWGKLSQFVSKAQYDKINKLIEDSKKPGISYVYSDVWLVIHYYVKK